MENETKNANGSSSNSVKNFSLHYETHNFHYESHKPGFHPRTPSSNSTTGSNSLQSFMSANSAMTPPAKRFHFYATQQQQHPHQQQQQKTYTQKVRNPFEAALAERLHLPTIASPSLFQRPTTPQLSSTQFEWTIDDVSSLKPVHVEPHETQFQDSPDPDYEAKAQSAISSFFKEHQIVPSPVNCPLRQQRIILAEINSNTPIAKPGRRIRDFGTQTALTLPPQLPAELEAALQPYLQPKLAGGYDCEGRRVSYSHQESAAWLSFSNCSNGSGSGSGGGGGGGGNGGCHNISMRRKLFDIHNIVILDENRKLAEQQQQTPTTPKPAATTTPKFRKAIIGKLSDSFDDDEMPADSLSEYFSPNSNATTTTTTTTSDRKQNSLEFFGKFNDDEVEVVQKRRSFLFRSPNAAELSPIFPSPTRNRGRSSRRGKSSPSKDFQTPAKISALAQQLPRRRLGTANAIEQINDDVDDDDDEANIELDTTKFTPDRSSSPLHTFYASASGRTSAGIGSGNGTFATDSFHSRFTKRLVVTSAGHSSCSVGSKKSGAAQSRILETTTTTAAVEFINDCTATMEDYEDDDAAMLMMISSTQLSAQNHSNLSSSSLNSHCDTPTGKKRSASRKNLSQSFTANWPATSSSSSDEEENGQNAAKQRVKKDAAKQTKKIVNEIIDKNLLPAILKATAHDDNDEVHKNPIPAQTQTQSQTSQHANFYRADSGFNEMTTSSSASTTSSALFLLSSQHDDETSRDAAAFVLKSNSDLGYEQQKLNSKLYPNEDTTNVVDMDVSMSTRCSTPTKRQQLQKMQQMSKFYENN